MQSTALSGSSRAAALPWKTLTRSASPAAALMRIGIDLGGTKTEAVAVADDGTVAHRRRLPTPRGYVPTLDAIAGLVGELESGTGERCSVGVGIPGVVSRITGVVKNANSTWLIGHPLQADLEARLGRPVRIGRPLGISGLVEAARGPAFAVAAGLLVYPQAAHLEHFEPRRTRPVMTGTGGYITRVGRWLRESF